MKNFAVVNDEEFSMVGSSEDSIVGDPAVAGEVEMFLFQTLSRFQCRFSVTKHFEQTVTNRTDLRVVLRIERHLIDGGMRLRTGRWFHIDVRHDFTLFPRPIDQRVIGSTALGQQILRIRREEKRNNFIGFDHFGLERLAFFARMKVIDGHDRAIVDAFGNGNDASIRTDRHRGES